MLGDARFPVWGSMLGEIGSDMSAGAATRLESLRECCAEAVRLALDLVDQGASLDSLGGRRVSPRASLPERPALTAAPNWQHVNGGTLLLDAGVRATKHLWLRYAFEFARRGLVLSQLKLNGPDRPPNDHVWGTARARTRTRQEVQLRFVGPRGCVGRHDARGLRLSWQDGWRSVCFPPLPASRLSDELRQLVRTCRDELRRWARATRSASVVDLVDH
jgi:hypothetical protein